MSQTSLSLDPRHVSRAIALQLLFGELVMKQVQAYSKEDLLEELDVEEADDELLQAIVTGVRDTITRIDPAIETLAPQWPIAQIAPVDLTIIRMGIWEAFIGKVTPPKVVINECIELAGQFSGTNSKSFVNGVLGNLLNNEALQKQLVKD